MKQGKKAAVWEQGEALLTYDGVQFKGKRYSCGLAIKERWFDRKIEEGPIMVSIQSYNLEPWHILVKVPGSEADVECLLVHRDPVAAWELDAYHEGMQILKDQRKRSRINRTKYLCHK